MKIIKIKWKPHVSFWDKIRFWTELPGDYIFYSSVERARKGGSDDWSLEDEVWVVWIA